tara:strand:- start:371 stop:709 length:339 start_codon:yes stop_codon:yes gene_type:complete
MKFIKKPWGAEEIIEHNENYVVKRLTMKKGHRCSLQYHNKKKETIYVISGSLNIISGNATNNLNAKIYLSGEFLTLNPGQVHRMEAVEDSIYLEASTPELDDVIRLKDDYER